MRAKSVERDKVQECPVCNKHTRGFEAVKCVVGTTVLPPSSVPQTKKKYSRLYLPPCDFECKTVKPYLLSRGIDEGLIDFFIAKK